MKAKFFSTLKDVHAIKGQKKREIEIEIKEGLDCLWIKPKGYGDHCSARNFGLPICLEIYEGRLRLIFWPDINKEEPTVIDMEGARETAREKEMRVIESNSLPYFGDDGLVNIFDRKTGKQVFVKKENFKDVTTGGGRMIGLFKFEVREEVKK